MLKKQKYRSKDEKRKVFIKWPETFRKASLRKASCHLINNLCLLFLLLVSGYCTSSKI